MLLAFLILIFFRPFISSLAFPYLNFVYSLGLVIFLVGFVIYKKVLFTKVRFLSLAIYLFILALLISLIFSGNKIVSFGAFYKYISAILLFLVAASLVENDRNLVVRTIILSGLVISLLAIYQYFFGFSHVLNYLANSKFSSSFISDYLQSRRVFVPFVTPGILGGYLAMVIPLFLIDKKRILLIFPMFFALFLTMSIGAFFSLFATLAIFICLKGKLKKKYIFGFLGLSLMIAIAFFWRSMGQREHVQPAFSTLMRLSYWRETWEIIKTHPLMGVGLGNFNLKLSRYAHNSYLQIWAEMGLLGLFSFLLIVYIVFKSAFKNMAGLLNNNPVIYLAAASIVFLIHNFLDFSFFLPEVSFIWWVILGLVIA